MATKLGLSLILILIGVLVSSLTVFAGGNGNRSVVTTNALLFDAGHGVRFSPFIPVNGSNGTLKRADDEVWAKVRTHRLLPGVYTNWWVVFNDVTGCGDDGCSGPDLPAAKGSVFLATGGIVDDHGRGSFEAHLKEGHFPADDAQVFVDFSEGVGLMPGKATEDPAEVHYVIRYHGPTNTNPGVTVEEMLTTFGGGCNNTPADKGPVGNFPCFDPQAFPFPLPNSGDDDDD